MKTETIEKIEQYLNNEMTAQERKDFELQLSNNDELRNEFDLYNSINNTMSATPNENELRQILQQMNQKYFAEGTAVKKGAFNKWLSIAASVILITAISLYFILTGKPSTEKLYSDYAQHTPLNIQMRGTASDGIAQKAATAFNNKNYSIALPLLEMYLQQQPEDIQMKFAAAVCYLETENYTAGEKIFTSIANGQTAYAEAAKWYLALMALKQQDLVKCRRILSSISNTSLYFTKATALLKKLPD